MAIDVASEITIGRPRAGVTAFSADPDNATRTQKDLERLKALVERP